MSICLFFYSPSEVEKKTALVYNIMAIHNIMTIYNLYELQEYRYAKGDLVMMGKPLCYASNHG